MQHSQPFAEVVESSLIQVQGQSWQWNVFPTFGSLVHIQQNNITIIALIYDIKTGSLDPSRYPFTYQKTEEELLQEQPQIFEFLRTIFSGVIVGYQKFQGPIMHQTCPQPPKIHAFISQAPLDLERHFFSQPHYLPLLFAMSQHFFNLDELLLALVYHLEEQKLLHETLFQEFIDQYSLLIGNDYRRLKMFLKRLQHLSF